MGGPAILVITLTIFAWGLVSGRVERADLTAPIVFVCLGGLFGAFGLVDAPASTTVLTPLVEFTLVWVLFSDAAGIPMSALRRDIGRYARLLGVGLPLTVLAGSALAYWLFPGLGIWLALLVGAALAPTDAALGLPVVANPAVPGRIRELITVESGLNDGIVTPVVVFALAGVASAEEAAKAPSVGRAVVEVAVGVVVGAVVGLAGGWSLGWARRRGWAAENFVGIAVLALAIVAYLASLGIHGNGFVAAFCGGLAFGASAGPRTAVEIQFLEQASGLVALLVWLAFGALAIPIMVQRVDLTTVLYAVLSLTVVRMAPVALACLGSGLGSRAVLFIGWFGPRGLASLVFALLALEELHTAAGQAVAVIAATVLLSVLAHGFSAEPLAARYGRALASERPHGPPPSGEARSSAPADDGA